MHRPRKRFGQNFLIDQSAIAELVKAIGPNSDDAILEIGPGLGALTKPLLKKVECLEVVEIDRDLIKHLQELNTQEHRFIIHQCDALKFDFSSDERIRRIVGNLPYNISTPLIFHLLEHIKSIRDMHFMLQNEVVDRICAPAGDRAYGRLSVMIQAKCKVEKLLEIGADKFSPPPKVTSGFVRLKPLQQSLVTPTLESAFAHIVKTAFSQPRKTLANNLKKIIASHELEKLGIDPSVRPQQLEISAFVAIAQAI